MSLIKLSATVKDPKAFWEKLSWNPALDPFLVVNHPELPWDKARISRIIPTHLIEKYPKFGWDFQTLSNRGGWSEKFIEETIDSDWNFHRLKVSLPFMVKYAQKKWDWLDFGSTEVMDEIMKQENWFVASSCPKLSIYFVAENPDKNWDWQALVHVTCLDVAKIYPDLPWNWNDLTHKMSRDELKQFADKITDWHPLSYRLADDFEFFHPLISQQKNLIRSYDISQIAKYEPRRKLELISKFPTLQWDVSNLTEVPWEIANKNLILDWNFSEMRGYSLSDVDSNEHRNWDWQRISFHPKLTLDFVIKHRFQKWNWCLVSKLASLHHVYQYPSLPWDMTHVKI